MPLRSQGMDASAPAPVPRWRMSPRRYRQVCVVALALLCVIVVSGAGVRLTGSGLGCDDWPNCNNEKLIDVSSKHAAIEQINRLFTGFVALGVIVAVLGSLVRVPRRRDLTWWSLGLVAGVLGQIVLGGITVLVDLHPAAVQSHFLLSMVLVANAVILVYRAGLADVRRRPVVSAPIRRHVGWVMTLTALALVAGTVVTGAGPHAGDEEARRFGIAITTAARIHSVAVWVAVAAVVALLWRLRNRPRDREVLDGPLTAWVSVAVLQGAIGYIQYFSGVPAVLVGLHIAGATALWSVTVLCREAQWVAVGGSGDGADEGDRLVDDAREEHADLVQEGAEGRSTS
jgi:cytochrome c oxidase assembly protein subunit 15